MSVQRTFDTVREGDELPVLEVRPDLGQVIRYCGISWVFPALFYDLDAARAQGMPGTIIPGPLRLGFLYRALEAWVGDAGFVRHVRAAHRRPDITNRPVQVTGRVARVYEDAGARRADIEMVILNEDGEPTVRGFGTVQFR